MITDIRWFNNYDYLKNKRDWNNFIKTIAKDGLKHQVFAIYFDDEDDRYKVYIASISGDRLVKDIYSFDEIMQFIHDNI